MLSELLKPGAKARTLCVLAHCDDETIVCGGLLARLAANGAQALVLTLCGRDAGRRTELEAACQCLGVRCATFDYEDAALADAAPSEVVGLVTGVIREEKPDLIITHDPEFDYNADHLFLGHCVVLAAQKAGMSEGGHRPRLLIAGEVHVPIPFPDYLVNVTAQMPAVRKAMASHASQLIASHKKDYYTRLLEARGRWRGVQGGCEMAMAFRRLALPPIGDLYGSPAAI
jgi:LmbE family N-acetylglucosaminyl deacetylase